MERHYRRPWRIDLVTRPDVARVLTASALARAIADALSSAGAPAPASIGLVLTDDAELAELNAAHLGQTGPTDVLSFPLLPPGAFPPHERGAMASGERRREWASHGSWAVPGGAPEGFVLPPGRRPHLGDIVVSVERAIAQAADGRGGQTGDVAWSAADELRLLVTHGTLHVCGWDHAEPVEETAMRALEWRLLDAGR